MVVSHLIGRGGGRRNTSIASEAFGRNVLADKSGVVRESRTISLETCVFVALNVFIASFYWNKTLGISSAGWFEFFGHQIADGKVPYRDFYYFSGPLFPMTIAGWFTVFGDSMTSSFAMGVSFRIAAGALVFGWLRAMQLPFLSTLIVTTTAVLIFSSDTADPTNLYNQVAIFFVVASGLLIFVCDRRGGLVWAFAAGASAGSVLLTKQTIGVLWLAVVLIALPILLALKAAGPHRHAGSFSWTSWLTVLAGAASVLAAVLGWLALNDAFRPFVDQVFVSGPTSKGSLRALVLRPLGVFTDPELRTGSYIGTMLAVAAMASILGRRRHGPRPRRLWLTVVLVLVIAAWAAIAFTTPRVDIGDRLLGYGAIIAGLACAIAGGIVYVILLLGRLPRDRVSDERFRQNGISLFLFAAMSCAVYFGLAVSFPIYEPMALPTFACVLVVPWLIGQSIATDAEGVPSPGGVLNPVGTVAVSFLILLTTFSLKAHNPYGWAGWNEPPIFESSVPAAVPKLEGLVLSPSTNEVVSRVVEIIEQESRSEDDIFAYPYLPIFYYLTGKEPVTFSYVHFPDVANDEVLRGDLRRLRDEPPRVVVMAPFTREEARDLELGFREGRPSGITEFNDFMLSIKDTYELRASWPTAGGELGVWVATDGR